MKDIRVFEPIWLDWVIDEKIGNGTYGTVWKAHKQDPFSGTIQYAAIKHISIPGENDDNTFRTEKEKREYYFNILEQLISRIDMIKGKPNMVSCEEYKAVPKEMGCGYDLFLRMELLKSIPEYKKSMNFSRDEMIRLGIDISTALETLENLHFIHGTIKPSHIYIDEYGHFRLGDFGISDLLLEGMQIHVGYMPYMAPEKYLRATNLCAINDQTSDIYSLGIILYRYMNNGFLPFMSENEFDPETAHIKRLLGKVPMMPPCNADEDLSRVILKACAYKPKERYQNAGDLKADLIDLL